MTFLSKFERANADLREASARRDREGLTPGHTEAIASLEDPGHDGGEPVADCEAESVKAFRDAYGVPVEYPQPVPVSAEDFRRGPIRAGRAAPSPGDDCA